MSVHRIALVGCGRVAPTHFAAIQELPEGFELVAVCDILADALDSAVEKTGATPYDDYETMLDAEKPDCVSICTPSGLHPGMGVSAAQRGVHVLTEKPIGMTLEAIDELIETCERNNVRLMCVKQNRLNPTVQLFKRAIDKGRFGHIYMAQANVFWGRSQDYYDLAAWRGTCELEGILRLVVS